jgi:hypothetical protein
MPDRVTISAIRIEQEGPGVDLSSLPTGVSVEMSDPEPGLGYARNMVTLTYDLSGFGNVALAFDAREFGDEPHAPKDEGGRVKDDGPGGADEGVFGPVADFDFDGVTMSDDLPSAPAGQPGGARWFGARGLGDLSTSGAGIGERQGAGGGPLLDRTIPKSLDCDGLPSLWPGRLGGQARVSPPSERGLARRQATAPRKRRQAWALPEPPLRGGSADSEIVLRSWTD